jgi:RES domain-containing protein
VRLWRIAAETRSYKASDLSGGGAAKRPGRWNAYGEPVVYCAPTIAIAVLETCAHIDFSGLPINRFVVEISVPDPVWDRREESLDPGRLPPAWDAIPAGKASVDFGSAWLRSMNAAILLLPSVIVVEEPIALINPGHPDSAGITATVRRRFDFNATHRPTGAR